MDAKIDYERLAMALLSTQKEADGGQRFKHAAPPPSTIMGHGPGGLFSTPGLSRPLFSAMLLPQMGLQSRLRLTKTTETTPIFGIITGVTGSSGEHADGVCDDCETVGVMKLCNHSFPLGRYCKQSRVFDIDRAGKVVNRGEFTDFQVFGNALDGIFPNLPTIGGGSMGGAVINEISKALFEFAVNWIRNFATQTYDGNPVNNTPGGGYREYYGLDSLINTGYRDAETGNLCPAADSIIRSFGNVDVRTNPALIVRTIAYIMRNLKFLASHANLDPVEWVLTMPFGCFYELTEVWPISYSTYRAAGIVPAGSVLMVGADVEMRMRDDMRGDLTNYTGQYLLIDGQHVPVIIDDAIPEVHNAGDSFTSSIYFVPLTVLGRIPVTYMEYFDYDTPGGSMDMAKAFAPGDSFYTTDSGRFLWHKKPPTNFCVQLMAKTEPRLLLLTPYLAARLTNVNYTPLMHERSWDPSNTSYFLDGGRTSSPLPNPSYLVVPG